MWKDLHAKFHTATDKKTRVTFFHDDLSFMHHQLLKNPLIMEKWQYSLIFDHVTKSPLWAKILHFLTHLDNGSLEKWVKKPWNAHKFFKSSFFTLDGVYARYMYDYGSLTSFRSLFQRWLIIPSEFFNMWNLRWPPKCHISIQFFGRCRFLNNQRKHRKTSGNRNFLRDNC